MKASIVGTAKGFASGGIGWTGKNLHWINGDANLISTIRFNGVYMDARLWIKWALTKKAKRGQ